MKDAATAPPSNSPTLRVGLTGGIASGKSTVSQLFGALGVPIVDADQIARALVAPGEPLLAAIFERFGTQLRLADGSLDRAALRELVFENAAKRRQLEALLHPAIRARSQQLAALSGGPYQIHVVPLLVETQVARDYDRVLVVDCSEELQLSRLQARYGCSAQQARAMLAAQSSRAARVAAADDIILNDAEPEALGAKVAGLHQRYLALAAALRRS